MNGEERKMAPRGIVTGSALTKNTPPEVISLNCSDDETACTVNEADKE